MRHNWTDALEAALRNLRAIANDAGFVTFAQINDAGPPYRFSSTEIEVLLLAVKDEGWEIR